MASGLYRTLMSGKPRNTVAFVLGKVNAPMKLRMTGSELAQALKDRDLSVAQLDCFFREVPVEAQHIFAHYHGLAEAELLEAARAYSRAMNRLVPLLSGEPAAWDVRSGPPPTGLPRLPPSEPPGGPVLSLLDMPGARFADADSKDHETDFAGPATFP